MPHFITPEYLMNLPESWTEDQYVSPNGKEVGLEERYGYNYLMKQVNLAQKGIVELSQVFSAGLDNLLDNWCFVNPLNRLNGYIAQADTEYYSDTELNTPVGVLSEPVVAQYVNSTYGIVTVNGSQYYISSVDIFSGYTTAKSNTGAFGFDRWWSRYATVVKNKAGSGIIVDTPVNNITADIRQAIPFPSSFANRQVTFSVLVTGKASANLPNVFHICKAETIGAFSPVEIAKGTLAVGLNEITVTLPADVGSTTYPCLFIGIDVYPSQYVIIEAMKFQLGPKQTLAYHNGTKWMLRDVSNQAIEIVRCNGAPVDIGGQSAIVASTDLGPTTANILVDAEVI